MLNEMKSGPRIGSMVDIPLSAYQRDAHSNNRIRHFDSSHRAITPVSSAAGPCETLT